MENVEDFVMEDSKFASGKVIFRFILTGWVVVGGGLKRQKIAVLGGEHAPPPHTHCKWSHKLLFRFLCEPCVTDCPFI